MAKIHRESFVIGIIRSQKGMTQEDFAYKAGLTQKFISSIENGKSLPGYDSIYKMAKALGMRPSELVKAMEEQMDREEQYWL